MIRIKMERRLKKKRTENWTPDEKKLLKRLIKDRHYAAIENKNNSTSANLLKTEAWKRIWEKFVVENRRPRTVQNLRDQWKRMKARRIHTNKEFQSNSEAVDGESDHNLDHNDDPLGQDTNISDEIPLKQFKCDNYNETRDNMSQNGSPKPKHLITQMFQKHKGGIEYKRSLLELNKVVKEQITNCAIEEHTLRMSQLQEEHEFRMKTMNELHQLECDNKRLQAQLMSLDIEIKKKQLNNFVL